MITRRIHKIFTCLIIFCWLATPAGGGMVRTNSAEIEAAFLVQFSKYVHWPARTFTSPEAPVVIGILGRDPFGSKIDRISRSFSANGRGVEVRRLRTPEFAGTCHILFVSADQVDNMAAIRAALANRPVLLVSNTDNFLSRGGMINFVVVGTKVRFDINLANSKNCALKISSKLLKIAHRVIQ